MFVSVSQYWSKISPFCDDTEPTAQDKFSYFYLEVVPFNVLSVCIFLFFRSTSVRSHFFLAL